MFNAVTKGICREITAYDISMSDSLPVSHLARMEKFIQNAYVHFQTGVGWPPDTGKPVETVPFETGASSKGVQIRIFLPTIGTLDYHIRIFEKIKGALANDLPSSLRKYYEDGTIAELPREDILISLID